MSRQQVLFLDDDHMRIDAIRARLASVPCELTVVETADECIARLRANQYDLVMLDHDLGGETFCDSSREDCGMEVVRWLKGNRGAHKFFMVHTMNAVAAAAMYLELNAMGYPVEQAPFGSTAFYSHVYAVLGVSRQKAQQKPSLSTRLGEYFRSLRGRR
jgi:CheY-like chemotaxis protein